MARKHWIHRESQQDGCQHSQCARKTTWQWQRYATDAEVDNEMNLQSPDGQVIRNMEGPHRVAVFACDEHTPKNGDGSHHLELMAISHQRDCPAPDAGCECE